ncbi:molybdenum ABC transporter ATP-binding protein [Thiobacillus denitrificans]|jgi:molybdate transport system ATP-binding protein|uniref:molybdenum ABC transporter ATP-binding protein n=1 Tax=Thiobacillus denitrificans TaxID=36861 RepID=UPI00036AD784|nr:molybdenum ABC transporter ATP-binding protein [Thiobacillus denitrificans]
MSRIEGWFRTTLGDFSLDADFSLPSHGVTALFGQSGSGKTTLLRLIAGLSRAPGRLVVGGEVWQDDTVFVPTQRRALGYVFQEASLFPHLSVRANLEYGWQRVPPGERTIRRDEVIDWLELAPLIALQPHQLSGGQRQRVAIGRALLSCPRLLLMDEPMAALDAGARADILPYLERLHRELELPLLYVSHALDEVARLADTLLLIEAGRIVYQGPLAAGLTRLDLPLAHRDTAATIIDATVATHDEALQLTHVVRGAVALELPGLHGLPGAPLRVRVAARDVSLALAMPQQTSILNLLPARVAELADDAPGQVLVRLALDDTVLLARITRKSAQLLGLQPGTPVVAQVKSVAVA